jgi:hypothetical protein
MEGSRPHNSKKPVQRLEDSKFARISHLENSPDISLTGIYLMVTVKQWLYICEDRLFEELPENVR